MAFIPQRYDKISTMSPPITSKEKALVSSTASSYSEWPINPKLEIRILELLPDSPETAEIRGNLTVAKFSDNPSYEALSYVWGDQVFPEKLVLPTGHLEITRNLAIALRHLRDQHRSRMLWVDAVCINQKDLAERGSQVMLMAEIYRSATCALGWLGVGNEETHAAIDMIKDFASRARQFGIDIIELDSRPRANDEGVKQVLSEIANQLDYPPFNAFYSQDWFSRLWIVQEVALPSKLVLYHGSETLKFEDFVAAQIFGKMLAGKLNTPNKDPHAQRAAWDLSETREHFQASESRSIHDIVSLHRNRVCVDPRDKIYGLLGLKQRNDPIQIVVDYGRNVEEVYQDFALKHLQIGKLSVLHSAGKGFNDSEYGCPKLSTWAPDWRLSRRSSPLTRGGGIFNAATRLSPSIRIDKHTSPSIIIGVRGVEIGLVEQEISTLIPESNSPLTPCDVWKDPQRVLSIKRQLTNSKQHYLNGEDIAEVFSQTLVMGNRREGTQYLMGKNRDPQVIHSFWTEFERALNNKENINDERARNYVSAVQAMSIERNFFVTEMGYFGMGPLHTRLGDKVVVFDSDTTPFVLRETDSDGHSNDSNVEGNAGERLSLIKRYELVGDCYVHGVMDNEVAAPEWRAKSKIFWIS